MNSWTGIFCSSQKLGGMKDHRFVLTSSCRPENLSTSTHLPVSSQTKKLPSNHPHAATLIPQLQQPWHLIPVSQGISRRDLVTWEWSHSEFRSTFTELLQRRILWLKSDSKENQDTLSSPSSPLLFMPVPQSHPVKYDPLIPLWSLLTPLDASGRHETFTSLKRHSKSCSYWEICWAKSLTGLFVTDLQVQRVA